MGCHAIELCQPVPHVSQPGTYQVGTMGIKFTSVVIWGQIDLCLVNETSNLDVVERLDHLDTLESTIGNEVRSVARLGAPCNLLCFCVTNGRVWLGRCPEAEI